MKIISGDSNIPLAKSIAGALALPLVNREIMRFANGEICPKIQESIRNDDIFVIATGVSDHRDQVDARSINDYVMETLLIIDACRRSSARSINLVMPCFPYQRQDKKDSPRVPISAKMMAKMFSNAGVNCIMCMDLHSAQIQGFFEIKCDNLYASKSLCKYIRKEVFNGYTNKEIADKFILVSPDAGGAKRIQVYSEKLAIPYMIMGKRRDYSRANYVKESFAVGGCDPTGMTAIIVDDMCDTMGTVVSAAEALVKDGLAGVIVVATHGLFSGPAIERINNCEYIKKVIVTNSVPQDRNQERCDKIVSIDIGPYLAKVMKCILNGESISALSYQ